MQTNFNIGTQQHAYVGTPCGTANASTSLGAETLCIVRWQKTVAAADITPNTTTLIQLVPDAWVGTGRSLFPQRITICNTGTTAVANITSIKIQDSYATAVVFSTTLVAALGSNTTTAFAGIALPGWTNTTNTSLSTPMFADSGTTPGYGLNILVTSGVTNAVTGSNLVISGWGFVR